MVEQFFIIGAQRSGTSYLYRLLDEHPEISMAKPARPEPKFFLRADTASQTQADYEAQYYGEAQVRTRGEKSTSYMESIEAARRIRAMFPRAHILAILREPAARAVSNYHFSVDHGVEPLGLWEALNRPPEEVEAYDRGRFSVSPWAYVERGVYAAQLAAWRDFPLHLELFETLTTDPQALARIYDFLGVPAFDPPSWGTVVNASEDDAALTPEQWSALRARFEESNATLERDFGLDLSAWK